MDKTDVVTDAMCAQRSRDHEVAAPKTPAPCMTAISINRRPERGAAPDYFNCPLQSLDGIRIKSGAVA